MNDLRNKTEETLVREKTEIAKELLRRLNSEMETILPNAGEVEKRKKRKYHKRAKTHSEVKTPENNIKVKATKKERKVEETGTEKQDMPADETK